MNAYELADDLEGWCDDVLSNQNRKNVFKKHAKMLRQQADQIAELEKEVKRLVGAEPITHGKLTFCKNCGQQDPYTQPKPLSDEEIEKTFDNTFKVRDFDGEFLRFARAIEERHGIK